MVLIVEVCVWRSVKVGDVRDEVVFFGALFGAMSIPMAVACARASPIAARL